MVTTDLIHALNQEIEQFQTAITELEERYHWLLSQTQSNTIPIPWDGTPEQVLRAAMLQAELNAQEETEKAGILQALALMQAILERKQSELERDRHGYN